VKTVPYWRLSGFYLVYFGSLGAFMPYWSLYLHNLGFNAQTIGTLMATTMVTKLIAPNVWGWLADHTGNRVRLIRFSSFLAWFCFLGVFFGHSFLWLAVVMSAFSFFWNAALPQIEATTLTHLGEYSHRYSHIRLWGSIGFIIVGVSLGWIFQSYGVSSLPVILAGLFAGIWVMSLFVPEQVIDHSSVPSEPLYRIIRQPTVIALFFVCLLMQASHGPYYTFYSIYLENHGYSHKMIGQLWALGVISEVCAFLIMHRLLMHFSLRSLLITSLILTSIRWLLIGFYVEWLSALLVGQLLHAVSYGVYHSVTIQFIHRFFVGRLQGRGQALYSSLSFGGGGALGSLLSGYTWENLGPQVSYSLSIGICLFALSISWLWIRSPKDFRSRIRYVSGIHKR